MFSQFIEKIQKQYSQELPFVVYRKPNDKIVKAIFQFDNVLHYTESFNKKGFVFSAFDDTKHILLQVDEYSESVYDSNVVEKARDFSMGQETSSDENFHLNLVAKATNEIKKEAFEKVVVSRRVETYCDTNPLLLFQLLLQQYEATFCYLWYHPKVGLWIGATPEILVKTNGEKITTMSLAGTQEYISQTKPIWGHKELREQNLVTQYIADNLKGKVVNMEVSSAESVRAGNLWHLKSTITGSLSIGLKEVVETLHPTPAVCGLPKIPSKNFVLENENYPREFYTGYLGELNFGNEQNQSHLFVNLRCMQLVKNRAYIYVGGGITSESTPEKELIETKIKSKTMLNIINFFK